MKRDFEASYTISTQTLLINPRNKGKENTCNQEPEVKSSQFPEERNCLLHSIDINSNIKNDTILEVKHIVLQRIVLKNSLEKSCYPRTDGNSYSHL